VTRGVPRKSVADLQVIPIVVLPFTSLVSFPFDRIRKSMDFVARMGEKRGAYRILVGRPEGKRALGRPTRAWEDNIKIDLQEVRWGMDWIELAQDRDR
jgi:hypothetical protein